MHILTVFLLCLTVSLTASKSVGPSDCGPVCDIYCAYGNVLDTEGCPTCQCRESPCEDGRLPLENYNCGRGSNRRECPSTHYCMISPTDTFAVCCPARRQTPGKPT